MASDLNTERVHLLESLNRRLDANPTPQQVTDILAELVGTVASLAARYPDEPTTYTLARGEVPRCVQCGGNTGAVTKRPGTGWVHDRCPDVPVRLAAQGDLAVRAILTGLHQLSMGEAHHDRFAALETLRQLRVEMDLAGHCQLPGLPRTRCCQAPADPRPGQQQ
jgi:hypothetical protein